MMLLERNDDEIQSFENELKSIGLNFDRYFVQLLNELLTTKKNFCFAEIESKKNSHSKRPAMYHYNRTE